MYGCCRIIRAWALAGIALGSIPAPASAITAEVAKKCNALIAKEFPPREIGNPAAGSKKGNGRDQRAYFNKCVANNGNMEESSAEKPAGEKPASEKPAK